MRIRSLHEEDPALISTAFEQIGWNKPAAQYQAYLREQEAGDRPVLVAVVRDAFAGYVTVGWQPEYAPFVEAGIPEIQANCSFCGWHRTDRMMIRQVGTSFLQEAR